MSELKPCPFCGSLAVVKCRVDSDWGVDLKYRLLNDESNYDIKSMIADENYDPDYQTGDYWGIEIYRCQSCRAEWGVGTDVCIAELEARNAELEAENGRLQESWLWETVCPDGSLRPKVSELLLNLDGWKERSNGWESIVETLNTRIAELEAAQRWIPVSERLPDTKIVYDKFDVIVELVDIVNGEMIRHVDLLSYDYRNKSWNDDCGEFGFYPVTGVTHWRERPTPPEVQELVKDWKECEE